MDREGGKSQENPENEERRGDLLFSGSKECVQAYLDFLRRSVRVEMNDYLPPDNYDEKKD